MKPYFPPSLFGPSAAYFNIEDLTLLFSLFLGLKKVPLFQFYFHSAPGDTQTLRYLLLRQGVLLFGREEYAMGIPMEWAATTAAGGLRYIRSNSQNDIHLLQWKIIFS